MKKQNKHWKDQLDEVLKENLHDDLFGTNIDWNKEDVRKYISKLEKLGATDIMIPDYETIKFMLPFQVSGWASPPADTQFNLNNDKRDNILMHILTKSPRPSNVTKYNDQLTLSWDY